MTETKMLPQHSSKTVEWNTPPEIIEKVYAVLDDIELDPASNNLANQTIGAYRYFTAANDGLAHDWIAKTVFLNPPYGKWTGIFTEKLICEFLQGNVEKAILLINSNTSTKYYQNALENCSSICFPRRRIQFIDSEGRRQTRPPHSNSIFLFDNKRSGKVRFKKVFKSVGAIIIGAAI